MCGLQKRFYLKTQFRELILRLVCESQSHKQNYLLWVVIIQAAFCQFESIIKSLKTPHRFKRISSEEPSPHVC